MNISIIHFGKYIQVFGSLYLYVHLPDSRVRLIEEEYGVPFEYFEYNYFAEVKRQLNVSNRNNPI